MSRKPKNSRRMVIVIALVTLVSGGLWLSRFASRDRRNGGTQRASEPAGYVGEKVCTECHLEESKQWRSSDHALAMQDANEKTALGDFNNAQFTYAGVTSTFYKKNGQFFVRTDGPDGKLQDFQVAYTFGYRPLQQYLVKFPDGKLQALGIAWDSRPRSEGGQRWFHLYPNQKITHDDPLHWTGRNQNWNYMCAECHSTNLKRNYDLENNRYATTWSEMNVSCETCHGPGSRHVEWAKAFEVGKRPRDDGKKGLLVSLKRAQMGTWEYTDKVSGTRHLKGSPQPDIELESCAPCHSRRHPLTDGSNYGKPFMDSYQPVLLQSGIYHADGQILDEVYEYGSFTQSRMYQSGVVCSNCHEPHSLKLKLKGNLLCAQCHLPAKFDAVQHHRHKPGSEAAQCINCHMPKKYYMVVDGRRDHSFRLPRPDLSVQYGTPNACNQCHTDRSAEWAAAAVAKWYGPNRRQERHFVSAIDAGRKRSLHADKALAAVALDTKQPAIVRATAISLLSDPTSRESLPSAHAGLGDTNPLVRMAAVQAFGALSLAERLPVLVSLLRDPVRMVRIEAARLLAGTPHDSMTLEQQADFDQALKELIAAEMASAERPESHLNLSLIYQQLGRTGDAEDALKTALRLDPEFVPALVNLADLYRIQKQDEEGEKLLRRAMAVDPHAVEPIYALGLLKGRQGKYQEALQYLGKAAQLRPDDTHLIHVYGVALHSNRQTDRALTVLKRALDRHPKDKEILIGLLTIYHERGDRAAAHRYADKLVSLYPGDPDVQRLIRQLR